MLERFYPTYVFNKVIDIPIKFFEEEKIHAIMIDMDNTIADRERVCDEKAKEWIKEVKKTGIEICILSNASSSKKVKEMSKDLEIKYVNRGLKPWSHGFKKAIAILNEDKENIVMIGDQVFTDVYGGNRFGIRTILVNPLEKNEILLIRLRRPLEKILIKKYKKEK